MPGAAVEPVTFKSRSGIVEEAVYAQPWMSVQFDDYEGMTQQQYQDSVSPFLNHGKSVGAAVPNGWRRVEMGRPGKHFYVHQGTGAISPFPKEQYDCKQKCWISKDGARLSEEALLQSPEQRALELVSAEVAANAAQRPPAPRPQAVSEAALEPAAASDIASRSSTLPVALLFPGQGSQYVGMLKEAQNLPAVQDMLAKAQKILGYDLLDICLNGPEAKLEQTKYCQPAMYIGGLAAVEQLRSEQPEKVSGLRAVAGLSLGEYTALTVAGVMDFETGLRIVKLRGEAMQEAAEASKQGMLSVAGLDQDVLDKLCKESCQDARDVCQIANFLFPKGFACAGSAEAVERLSERALATKGCLQAKMLKTSGAFHTSMMQGAREKLVTALRDVEGTMKPPRCEVYMNVSGAKITPEATPSEIIDQLSAQLVSCVLWEPSVRQMIEDGLSEFYECGPMKQLKAMMKRIDTNAWNKTTSVGV